MARKSSIKTLPPDILKRLNQLLADDVMTLADLVAWLDEVGHPRSMSAIHRHKQHEDKARARLRRSREVTDALARELGESAVQGQQGRVLVEMARTFVFDMMMRLDDNEDAVLAPQDVAFLGKGLAELARALRFDQDFELKVRREAADKAAKAAKKAAKKAGLSADVIATIEREVLGITS